MRGNGPSEEGPFVRLVGLDLSDQVFRTNYGKISSPRTCVTVGSVDHNRMTNAAAPLEPAEQTLRSEFIDPLADSRWQDFVEQCPDGSVFHHASWLRLLQAQYSYPLLARCVVSEADEIVAGLPFAHIKSVLTGNRLVALPFSDICGPLSSPEHHDQALTLLSAAVRDEHARTHLDTEIRGPLGDLEPLGSTFYHHSVPLGPDVDAVSGRFSSMTRRGVARARREGVEVHQGVGVDDLDVFYRLHLRTRARQGIPTQPRQFIRRFASLFDEGLGFVLIAKVDGVPAAAAVYLCFNGVLTYKYGASARASLSRRPNHAIFMHAIRWGCDTGQRVLDLGRTDIDNEGLRAFKLGWGGCEQQVSYVGLSRKHRSAAPGVPAFLRAALSKAPPITGRIVGEALYRHFG